MKEQFNFSSLNVLIYEHLNFEEQRFLEAVEMQKQLLKVYPRDSYFITRYYEAVRKYEDFIIFKKKIEDILASHNYR